MKHVASRTLLAHWNDRRGSRHAPAREDIDPGAIRTVLADVFILGREADAPHRFRLAGTRVCALFGRELKGVAFADLWDEQSRAAVHELINVSTGEVSGAICSATGLTRAGERIEMELLLLPLLYAARFDRRTIGVLTPLDPADRFCLHPIERMTLGHFRYLDLSRTVSNPAYARSGLTLYRGGHG